MHNRNSSDPFYDTLADIAVGIVGIVAKVVFSLVWVAIAVPVTLILKAVQAAPEDQLRAFGQATAWGEQRTSVNCRHCGTPNDQSGGVCSFCGALLQDPRRRQLTPPDPGAMLRIGLLLLTALIIVTALLMLSAH